MKQHRGLPKICATLLVGVSLWLAACGDDEPGGSPQAAAGQAGEPAQGEPNAGAGGTDAKPVECPLVIASAEGTDCSAFGEGAVCTDTGKCGGGDTIVCVDGVWERRQALAIPC